ncbi:hypothetical protein BHU72_10505 [Desulfuribacillus stibiiarsenatis]|uniref:HAMP domain-containing protein n=1 Tax=Desulfuribacillus stibiiarsenatis TaxID=1390249 RepID=A0A1E5L947_9FIRM|nr:hypothetical protein [Desulfuribacillus stibiiarsenatis]OEH86670.1 hypothetical protein BHU72_10505 [Desulfuribacillus stibiiarsenatis]
MEGAKRLAYYQKLESSDWIIASAIDVSEVTTPIITILIYSVMGLIFLSVVLAIGQVKLYEKRFVKPINLLRDHIEELTLGKDIRQINTQHSYSNSELAEIASRIVDMARKSQCIPRKMVDSKTCWPRRIKLAIKLRTTVAIAWHLLTRIEIITIES